MSLDLFRGSVPRLHGLPVSAIFVDGRITSDHDERATSQVEGPAFPSASFSLRTYLSISARAARVEAFLCSVLTSRGQRLAPFYFLAPARFPLTGFVRHANLNRDSVYSKIVSSYSLSDLTEEIKT